MSLTNSDTSAARKIAVPWTGGAPADYDILANAPGGGDGQCCRTIVVSNPTGSLVVVDSTGATVTIPQAILLESPVLPVELRSLVAAGSSAATVMVLW